MAIGGSTNAVLHLLAIAHAAEVPLALDDFEAVRARVPVLCDLKPSGRYVTTEFHRSGGVPQVMRMLLDHGLLHGDCLTITGKTVAETLAGVPSEPPAGQEVIRPWSRPVYAQGHLAILRGNLATEGAVAKITGVKHPVITGPARVFDSEESCIKAIFGRRIRPGDVVDHPLRGAEGRPRDARDALADLGPHRGRARRLRGPRHRRSLLRRHVRPGGRARGARGGGRRRRSPSCARAIGSRSTRRSACSSSRSTSAEIARRRAGWTPPAPRYTRGVLAKYARLVGSAARGAVTDAAAD